MEKITDRRRGFVDVLPRLFDGIKGDDERRFTLVFNSLLSSRSFVSGECCIVTVSIDLSSMNVVEEEELIYEERLDLIPLVIVAFKSIRSL